MDPIARAGPDNFPGGGGGRGGGRRGIQPQTREGPKKNLPFKNPYPGKSMGV